MFLLNLHDISIILSFFLFFVVTYHIIYNLYFHPLAKFPGPFLAKITPLYDVYWFLYKEGCNVGYERYLHKTYGSIVRRTPNMLAFDDPRLLPTVYNRYAAKGPSYDFFGILGLLGIKNHREHTWHRRMVAAPFSGTAVVNMRPLVEHRADKWVEALGVYADSGEAFDYCPWGDYFTYDIISELVFGEPLGFIEERGDHNQLIKAFHQGMIEVGVYGRLPALFGFMNKWSLPHELIHWFSPDKPPSEVGLKTILGERDRQIEFRLKNPESEKAQKPDMLNHMLEAHRKHPKEFTMDLVRRDTAFFMIAGSDTTGSEFRLFVLNLLTHPDTYKKLMETDFSPGEKRPYKDRHYFQACIKETLRLTPPVTQIFPRPVCDDGIVLPDGRFVPGRQGIEMNGSTVDLCRSKLWWGEDAEEWRPERWLKSEREVLDMEKGMYTFGYGARICLGKAIAELEGEVAFAKLLESFDMELVNPEKPYEKHEDYGMQVYRGFWLRLKRRSKA